MSTYLLQEKQKTKTAMGLMAAEYSFSYKPYTELRL